MDLYTAAVGTLTYHFHSCYEWPKDIAVRDWFWGAVFYQNGSFSDWAAPEPLNLIGWVEPKPSEVSAMYGHAELPDFQHSVMKRYDDTQNNSQSYRVTMVPTGLIYSVRYIICVCVYFRERNREFHKWKLRLLLFYVQNTIKPNRKKCNVSIRKNCFGNLC